FWPPMRWAASASEILNEEASEDTMSNSFRWMGFWGASASDILNEEASVDTMSNSAYWAGTFALWRAGASEILNDEASEESGQPTDDF
ncbi:hypothetical protein EV363DRAFT_1176605, partial [Boletus edulis]